MPSSSSPRPVQHRHHAHSKSWSVYRQLRHQLSLFAGVSSGEVSFSHQFKSVAASFGTKTTELESPQRAASVARRHATMPTSPTGFVPYDDSLLTSDGFTSCVVVSSQLEAEGMRLLTLDVPAMVRFSHTAAGQYVKLRTSPSPERQSKTSYFAIASPPPQPLSSLAAMTSERHLLSILLKDAPSNDVFWQASSLEISPASGGGFGIEDALFPSTEDAAVPYEHVLLVATGTGVAPIAAAIDSIVAPSHRRHRRSLPRRITLLIGVRHPSQLPFTSRMQHWVTEHGVRVVPAFSQVDDGDLSTAWGAFDLAAGVTLPAHHGYVQDVVLQALADAIPDLVPASVASDGRPRASLPPSPRQTLVLVCGQPAMMAAVTDLCLDAGVPQDNIRKNF